MEVQNLTACPAPPHQRCHRGTHLRTTHAKGQLIFSHKCTYIRWACLVAQAVKNVPAVQETWDDPWVRKIPWRRKWQPTPVFLPGEVHGQRSLDGGSPVAEKKPLLTPCWNCFFDLLFVAIVIIIIQNGLSQRILPPCLTVKLSAFVQDSVHLQIPCLTLACSGKCLQD